MLDENKKFNGKNCKGSEHKMLAIFEYRDFDRFVLEKKCRGKSMWMFYRHMIWRIKRM
jgi:hypothetical protein